MLWVALRAQCAEKQRQATQHTQSVRKQHWLSKGASCKGSKQAVRTHSKSQSKSQAAATSMKGDRKDKQHHMTWGVLLLTSQYRHLVTPSCRGLHATIQHQHEPFAHRTHVAAVSITASKWGLPGSATNAQ
jgi:hypothetical protein